MSFIQAHPSFSIRESAPMRKFQLRPGLRVAPARGEQYLAAITALWLVIQMFDVLFAIGGSYELALALCVMWIAVPLFFTAPQSFLLTGISALMAGKGRSSVLLMV